MEQQRPRPARPLPPVNQMDVKLKKVSECYESSMCHVSNGLADDESGNVSAAIENYVKALCCLEMGIGVELPRSQEQKCRDGWMKQAKMMDALENIRTRLYELQQGSKSSQEITASAPEMQESPPEFTPSSSSFQSQGQAFEAQDAVELLNIPSGVQIYCVSGDLVNAPPPSYPTTLQIMLFDESQRSAGDPNRPPAFIQVGDWRYPLLPGQSPVLKCTNGAYVFPNLKTDSSAKADNIGLVLSSQLDPSYREMFENILGNFAVLQVQDHAASGEPEVDLSASVPMANHQQDEEAEEQSHQDETLSEKLAYGIGKGAGWLSWGLSKGAEMTTSLIKQGSTHLQKNLTPNEKPTDVNPTLQKGLHYTNEAAKVTVKVSGAVVKGVSTVAGQIAEKVAPRIKSCADSVLPQSATKKDESGKSQIDGVFHVAGAGLTGIGTIWNSLENAGLAIARSASSATVQTVEFKYGSSAGLATSNAVGAAVNLGRTAFNIDNIGMKAIAKKTAKETGKAFLRGYVEENKKPPTVKVEPSSDDLEKQLDVENSDVSSAPETSLVKR